MNPTLQKHLHKAKELTTQLIKIPTTQVVLISALLGSTGALVKETISQTKSNKSPIKQALKVRSELSATGELLSPKVSESIAKYEKQKQLLIDAQDKLTATELWDVVHQLPQYWDYHDKRDSIVNKEETIALYNLDTTEANALMKKHGIKRVVLNEAEIQKKIRQRGLTQVSHDHVYTLKGERPSNAPLGFVVHMTLKGDENGVSGNSQAFGTGKDSVHFIISKQGDILQMAPLSGPSTAAYVNIYDTHGGSVRKTPNDSTALSDQFLDTFFLNVEIVGTIPGKDDTTLNYIEPKQQAALFDLLSAFQKEYHFPTENIIGHMEGNNIPLVREFFPGWVKDKKEKKLQSLCKDVRAAGTPSKIVGSFPALPQAIKKYGEKCHTIVSHAFFTNPTRPYYPAESRTYHSDNSHKEMEALRKAYIKAKLN